MIVGRGRENTPPPEVGTRRLAESAQKDLGLYPRGVGLRVLDTNNTKQTGTSFREWGSTSDAWVVNREGGFNKVQGTTNQGVNGNNGHADVRYRGERGARSPFSKYLSLLLCWVFLAQ